MDDRSSEECLDTLTSLWQETQQFLQELSECFDRDVPARLLKDLNSSLSAMLPLIICEEGGAAPGPCLQYVLKENMLETLYKASVRSASEEIKRMLLRLYQLWLGKSSQCLLIHDQIVRPLKRLLHSCARQHQEKGTGHTVDLALVNLLLELCEVVNRDHSLVDLFFLDTSPDIGHSKFTLFSFLLPYIHDEDPLGTSARDGIMILLGISTSHPRLLRYVTENSNFCTVLVGGMAGLYSALPTGLPQVIGDDWHHLDRNLWTQIPQVVNFVNSLSFVNSVVQVSIPGVTQTVLSLMHDLFLVQVMAPAFHQPNTYGRISVTAYFSLFIEQITEPLLLREFVQFITNNKQLCAVSLSLFQTLIDLHCEEVMLQLVFNYLLPCDHIVPSERHCVGEVDTSKKAAEKFLSLIPDCCVRAEQLYNQSEEKVFTPASSPPESLRSSPVPTLHGSPRVERCNLPTNTSLLESVNMSVVPTFNPVEVSYYKYVVDARAKLRRCASGCFSWSHVYDKPLDHRRDHTVMETTDGFPRTALFLCTVIDKVSDMLSHPHHVNLLLTGLITQLSLFPQPLLTSFLLSPNLKVKPRVPNLIQVLTEIKAQIDELSEITDGLDVKIARARKTLIFRELNNDSLHVKVPQSQSINGEREWSRPRKKITTSRLFAIVVYHEFLKELAAIAEEQASGFSF
ncbi:FHF complex subunit HOOK-interacting protein 1A-like isoform X2 [Corticium candelabrum]|uniref:FHF complex subunit HOOK-interacting protein 1A-like isoform X2 n=1 Tax=Corticium candelabrum TaxID=121492 RepID=UPI002E269CD3|nr:FHF complex subunit HOOK-interacting protein 1A-like isoform X2 [Corticium candelabrum]